MEFEIGWRYILRRDILNRCVKVSWWVPAHCSEVAVVQVNQSGVTGANGPHICPHSISAATISLQAQGI